MSLAALVIITAITLSGICMSLVCGPAEYEVDKECCPMCGPGYHVYKHCTEYTSTSCVPCPASTYTDAQNKLEACTLCTVCASTAGLRVKRACSSTSDTLCEPLEGHYCTDPIKDGCRGAVEHTKCSPGQYIKHNGSASSDTVCGDCGENTYSDGSFTSCRPHTQCEIMGFHLIKEGSSSNDAECGGKINHTVIITIIIITVIIIIIIFAVMRVRLRTQNESRHPQQGNIVDFHLSITL